MNRLLQFACAAVALFAAAAPADAALNVFACEPEWASLVSELGGDKVDVFTATTGRQDPHQIQARPALIARLRKADLAVCTGAELEIGWMPVLLRQAANAKVQPGKPGFFAAAEQVQLKEIPTRLDRAEGDIHAAGNPHIQTDPRNMVLVAQALTPRLVEVDRANAEFYLQRGQDFVTKMTASIERWQAAAAPLRGQAVLTYHRSWIYLLDWLGLRSVGEIEPKPGVPPSSGYLAELLAAIPARKPRIIIYAGYEEPRAPQFVGEKSGLPAVQLPFTVGGTDEAKDVFGFYDDTIRRLVAAMKPAP